MVRKNWSYSPKKLSVIIPLNEKESTENIFRDYSLSILNPLLPNLRNGKFRQYTNFFGVWKRNYFYIGLHVKDSRDNVFHDEHDELRIRLEYRGTDSFLCSYMRHTGNWHELTYGKPVTLEECFLLSKSFLIILA